MIEYIDKSKINTNTYYIVKDQYFKISDNSLTEEYPSLEVLTSQSFGDSNKQVIFFSSSDLVVSKNDLINSFNLSSSNIYNISYDKINLLDSFKFKFFEWNITYMY